ncbi:MAG: Lrp/AsnC family transcriptional regulator [Clostridia bacterium]|nr:Lrp/AsnC family transcriptional regulator [Clostridia bacterium]MBQ3870104.1 Lrp/AsnC family transcriptional regulator [Clostridia bacterium]
MNELLKLLEKDSRLTPEMLAAMLSKEVGDIKKEIEKYEKDGTIVGYNTLIDWDKTDREYVTALIELKITPQRDIGFDRVAERIYNYPEVQSLYLMSGGFDLCVLIEGKTLKEVALFVAEKLAPMDSVVSTATHFVLRKYKDKGLIYKRGDVDLRGECL